MALVLHLGGVGEWMRLIWKWSVHGMESGDLQFMSFLHSTSCLVIYLVCQCYNALSRCDWPFVSSSTWDLQGSRWISCTSPFSLPLYQWDWWITVAERGHAYWHWSLHFAKTTWMVTEWDEEIGLWENDILDRPGIREQCWISCRLYIIIKHVLPFCKLGLQSWLLQLQ
jgi:hypothetical protein